MTFRSAGLADLRSRFGFTTISAQLGCYFDERVLASDVSICRWNRETPASIGSAPRRVAKIIILLLKKTKKGLCGRLRRCCVGSDLSLVCACAVVSVSIGRIDRRNFGRDTVALLRSAYTAFHPCTAAHTRTGDTLLPFLLPSYFAS